MGLLAFVLPGFICFFVLFYNELFYQRVMKYVWNITLISLNPKKNLTVFQFIFTNCLHSLVPNCPYNGHFTLVKTWSSLAYQSFRVSSSYWWWLLEFLGIPQHYIGKFLGTQETFPFHPQGQPRPWRDSPLLCGPPGELPVETRWQASFLASRSLDGCM